MNTTDSLSVSKPLVRNRLIRRLLSMRWIRRPLQRLLVAGYYVKHPPRNKELARVVGYVVRRGYKMLPCVPKYKRKGIGVHSDSGSGYRYVVHEGKRLYFPLAWSDEQIRGGYAMLLREQDERSPHRYLTPEFDVGPQTHLFDIGAAEGILALSVIDRVAAVHLFEAEEKWLEPLKLTFAPWKEKAHIVRKYVSDVDDEQNITLDTYTEGLQAEDVLLKMDVEGSESQVLAGGGVLLGQPNVRAAICTYHKAQDYEQFSTLMHARGYRIAHSPGYVMNDGLRAPWFRRGVIYCTKQRIDQ